MTREKLPWKWRWERIIAASAKMEALMDLSGKSAFVSGANRGLGKALVDELLIAGCRVVFAGCRAPMSDDNDCRVVPISLDVTSQDSVMAAAAQCRDVSVLINNAGVMAPTSATSLDGEHSLAHQLDVNVYGLLRMVNAFSPVLRSNGGGSIVNMLSVASWCVPSFAPIYAATKHAAAALTIGQRIELRSAGIRVIGAFAGPIDTDMIAAIKVAKTRPAMIANAIINGIANDEEIILCDAHASTLSRLSHGDQIDERFQQKRWDDRLQTSI